MSERIQTLRGMHDVLPSQVYRWHHFEACVRELMAAYGYDEIRTPLMESTALFKRSIGEATDIVEKEMFTFVDNERISLTLRPENTASCVRSGIEHGFMYQSPVRMWYLGGMFRHERPQKGRYRQFHQFGVEAFGFAGTDIEAEVLAVGERLWRRLGIAEHVELQINTLGTPAERARYRELLVDYFSAHAERLDDDSRRRLSTNPLRILDSKNRDLQALIEAAPTLWDNLGEESREHFDSLRARLEVLGIAATLNPRLVRGLDYYTHTVFEWVTDRLGSQSAVCAGGRYDGLVEQLGGKPTPGVGFAAGIERLLLLMEEVAGAGERPRPHAYLVSLGEAAVSEGLRLAETLRTAVPGLRLVSHCGGGSMKSQMKKADRSGAQFALLLGEEELSSNLVCLKPLRAEREQERVSEQDLVTRLTGLVEREP